MASLKGVYRTSKKDGSIHYRSSITYCNKHISLGSYNTEVLAHEAYNIATSILLKGVTQVNHFMKDLPLPHDKWVILHNFRDNGDYFITP